MALIKVLNKVLLNIKLSHCKLKHINILNSVRFANTEIKIQKLPSVVQNTYQDLSGTTSYFPPTFNIAAYVNNSETLKKLVNMNVDLSKIEKKPYLFEMFLKLDFEKDMKNTIFFLSEYVESDKLVNIITKNPLIFRESLDDLQVRVNYLVLKLFRRNQIKLILENNPYWLLFSTKRIDRRLGHFQDLFKLTGDEVRNLAAKQPRIITYNLHHIKTNSFVIKEEMGFQDSEIKSLLLQKPKLWLMNQKSLLGRFNYLHNEIKFPHSLILKFPQVLECRIFKIKQRHLFLEKLGRAQFNPEKENYVPLMALAEGTDSDFCKKYAKCGVSDFNIYLKTL